MLHNRDRKVKVLYQSQAIANNTTPSVAAVDTLGFDSVEIQVLLGATDIALTALKLQESDASGSGFADITGTRFGTDNDETGTASALPAATDDNKVYSWTVDLRGSRKRYLKPIVTIGNGSTGAFLVVIAILDRARDTPRTAAQAGLATRITL